LPPQHSFKTCWSPLGTKVSPHSFSSRPQACNTTPRPLAFGPHRRQNPPVRPLWIRSHHHYHYRLCDEFHPPRRSIHFSIMPHSPSLASYCRTSPPPLLATSARRSCCCRGNAITMPPSVASPVLCRYSEPHPLSPCPADTTFDPGAHAAAPATPTRPNHHRRGRRTMLGDRGSGTRHEHGPRWPLGPLRPWTDWSSVPWA
jgi:hypothetical protein